MARILVVDDEINVRTMIRLALQHVGHRVDPASEGEEALREFRDGNRYDLTLLDYRMPGMTGLEVLEVMRARNPNARIIMITAFGTIDLAVDAMKAGATDFLRKPFTVETLRGAVTAALEGTRPDAVGTTESGITYGSTTMNGFRVESRPSDVHRSEGDITFEFTVTSPAGESRKCEVILPSFMVELVKAHAGREQMPGGDRFWHALCEEAIANFVWQHAEYPPDDSIRIDELTTPLSRLIEATLSVADG